VLRQAAGVKEEAERLRKQREAAAQAKRIKEAEDRGKRIANDLRKTWEDECKKQADSAREAGRTRVSYKGEPRSSR